MARKQKGAGAGPTGASPPNEQTAFDAFPVSRRAVLGGSLASTIASAAPNLASTPSVEQVGDTVEVTFADKWIIDPAKFKNAKLDYKVNDARTRWTIGVISKAPGGHPTYRGSDLYADMLFDIFQTGGRWVVDVTLRMHGVKRAPLADWCAGTVSLEWPQQQIVGIDFGGIASLSSFEARLALGRDLEILFVPTRPAILKLKRFLASVSRFTVPAAAPGPAIFEFGEVKPQASSTSLTGAKLLAYPEAKAAANALKGEAIIVGGLREQILLASFGSQPKLKIEFSGDGLLTQATLSDTAASLIVTGPGLKDSRAAIKLDTFTLVSRLEAGRESARFLLEISKTVQLVSTSRFAIAITGRDVPIVTLTPNEFALGNMMEVRVAVTDVSVAAAAGQLCDVSFGRTSTGALADPGLLPRPSDMLGLPTNLLLGRESNSASPPPLPGTGRCEIRLASNGYVNLDIETGRLRLRRTIDGFDLAFGFIGYSLMADGGKTRLVPIAGSAERLQIAHFWSQHLLEEAFSEDPTLISRLKARVRGEADPRRSAPTLRETAYATGRKSRLARTRASGPSRIVFDRSKTPAVPIEATITALTAWAALPLRTDKRAARKTLADDGKPLTLDRQIVEIAGITASMSRDDARKAIRLSFGAVDGSSQGRISDRVTALELVTGLQFSPSPDATFRTTAEPRAAAEELRGTTILQTEQWSASLSRPEGAVVRAIMATDLNVRMFEPVRPADLDEDKTPFVSALNRGDRREIVVLSSGFGIAARRALILGPGGKPQDRDDSLVALPSGVYNYLTPARGPNQPSEEGVMAPRPFERFDAKMMPFGADIDIEWRGEPPASVPDPRTPGGGLFFDPAFNVQRYTHRTRAARDVFAEVQYKGYLFPLGFRASLIKVTRREACYDKALGWIYPLIQREYIVTTKPERSFTGPYHPFAARDMHAASLEMKTLITPFLDEEWSSQPYVPEAAGMRASWVRVGGNDFEFEYSADGLAGTRQVPMLFLDNSTINTPAVMQKIVEKYQRETYKLDANRGSSDARRVERFNASEALFAPSTKLGDTNFETDAALLSVRGRLSDAGVPTYTMDAFMEGADQPPFYPFLERARIRVRSLERLTGLPTSRVEVRHFDGYREGGFEPTANAGEIFLEVLTPGIGLGLSDKGGATGGVARPEAALAALSRRSGLIGGRESIRKKRNVATFVVDETEAASEFSYDVSAAAAGKFDPAQFFKGATLLGIVPLDIIVKAAAISAAPLMKEMTEVGALTSEDAARIANLLEGAVSAADKAEASANATISDYFGNPGDPAYTLAAFYPELAASLAAFKQKLTALVSELRAGASAADLLQTAPAVIEAWPPLRRAIDQLARDPMPTIIKEAITEFKTQAERLFTLFKDGRDPASEFVKLFLKDIETDLYDRLASALATSGMAELIFGPIGSVLNPDPSDLALPHPDLTKAPILDQTKFEVAEVKTFLSDLANDPSAAGIAIAAGITERQFGTVLVDLLATIAAVASGNLKHVVWPQRAIEAVIVERLVAQIRRTADTGLRARLTREASADDRSAREAEASSLAANVGRLRSAVLAKASRSCLVAINARLTEAGAPPTDPTQLRAWLERQLATAKDAVADVIATLASDLPLAVNAAKKRFDEWKTRADELKLKLEGRLTEVEREGLKPLWAQAATILQNAEAHLMLLNELAKTVSTPERRRVIAGEIIDGAIGTLARALPRLPRAEERGAALVQRLVKLLGKVQRFADEWQAAALRSGMAWCAASADPLLILSKTMLRDFVPSASMRQLELEALKASAADLDLPLTVEPAILTRARDAAAGLRGSISDLQTMLLRMDAARAAALETLPTTLPCAEAARALRPLRDLYQLWRAAFVSADRMVEQLGRFYAAYLAAAEAVAETVRRSSPPDDPTLPQRIKEALSALEPAAKALEILCTNGNAVLALIAGADTVDRTWTALAPLVKPLPAAEISAIDERVKALKALLTSIDRKTGSPDALHANLDITRRAVETAIADLLGRLASYGVLGGDAAAQVIPLVERIAIAALGPVDRATDQVLAATKDIRSGLNGGNALMAIAKLLGKPLLDKLELVETALDKDSKALKAAAAKPPVANAFLTILRGWDKSEPGLMVAARTIEEVFRAIAQGQIGKLVDLGAARQAIEDALAEILPTKAKIDYFWGSDLSPFPANDPVFAMEPSIPYDASVEDKDLPPGDLAIVTRTEVDFRKPGKPKLNAYGRLKPFSIHLLGSAFDLVTIRFKGAYFKVKDGGSPEFSADIEGVTIGPMLQFLQALAPFMGGRPDNGLYAFPVFSPPGFEVGYRFSSDTIQLGSLQFINVSLLVSAMLPFDARHAEFRFQFASRERPFLIASPPYGGGGSVALVANARGITRFELQFEFGAVMDLRIGPFKGHGRVTAGIYIEFGSGNPVLEGFVHAVGEGSVACFSLTINIEVRVRQANGSMVGQSTYRVEFRVGFAKFKYSITARYKISGKDQGGMQALALMGAGSAEEGGEPVHILMPNPGKIEDWAAYRKLFGKAW